MIKKVSLTWYVVFSSRQKVSSGNVLNTKTRLKKTTPTVDLEPSLQPDNDNSNPYLKL